LLHGLFLILFLEKVRKEVAKGNVDEATGGEW